jgi:hypothetical protein
VHFAYLLEAGGGLLTIGNGFDEHLAQLDATLQAPTAGIVPFVREFVRPLGLERDATPIFVAGVEAMHRMRVEPAKADFLAPLWRSLLRHIAARATASGSSGGRSRRVSSTAPSGSANCASRRPSAVR